MSALTSPRLQVQLHDQGRAWPAAERAALLRALLDGGFGVDAGAEFGAPLGPVVRLGRGAFEGELPEGTRFCDASGLAPAEVLQHVEQLREQAQAPRSGTWKPWFPVIDYQRCTNCMQCLSFCLFEVYGSSAQGKLEVRHQDNCKTDCPACSRVCPEVAILFPKYRHSPINGDDVRADDVRREAMKVDISALLGGDVYALLKDRTAKAKSRFSKERDEERALKERQTCLINLQRQAQGFDVPAEVLAALPSVDEIQKRAEAAQARARAALEAAQAPVPEPGT